MELNNNVATMATSLLKKSLISKGQLKNSAMSISSASATGSGYHMSALAEEGRDMTGKKSADTAGQKGVAMSKRDEVHAEEYAMETVLKKELDDRVSLMQQQGEKKSASSPGSASGSGSRMVSLANGSGQDDTGRKEAAMTKKDKDHADEYAMEGELKQELDDSVSMMEKKNYLKSKLFEVSLRVLMLPLTCVAGTRFLLYCALCMRAYSRVCLCEMLE